MGHPGHFHLFHNAINIWKDHGHQVKILIRKKDVLEALLQSAGMPYINILKEGRRNSKLGMIIGLFKRSLRLFFLCLKERPDVLTGTSVENSWVGKILGIPVINTCEDDIRSAPLYAKLSFPWASTILSPYVCDIGKWNEKAVRYASNHELAYLHPKRFTPDRCVVERYFPADEPYFIIRLAKHVGHHDVGARGIDDEIARKLIEMLTPHGAVYISSERDLEPDLEPFRIPIDPLDIHHVMAFTGFLIADSQTMAAESGVLGVPYVRFSDFTTKLSYVQELEDVYHLGYGIPTSERERLYTVVEELIMMPDRATIFRERRKKLLEDKIDYTGFLAWFVENWPESGKMMSENPGYQYNFK